MEKELAPFSIDEYVQVEDLNQEERAAVLKSSIAADEDESVPTTMVVREGRPTVLQETVRPLTTDLEPVPGVKVDEILKFILKEIKCVKEDVTELTSLKEDMKALKMMMEGISVVKEDANTAGDEKYETDVNIPESDSMRRINIQVTNCGSCTVEFAKSPEQSN
jgi:hypothetical protein